MAARPIIIFDSGLGGLTVFREIVPRLPGSDIVYIADNEGFPYGDWPPDKLVERILRVLTPFINRLEPDAVVIACNTASTIVLPALRARFSNPFVGTVPAIKVAASVSRSGLFSVLATPETVKRDYTQSLIERFASACDVTLVGPSGLADMAERKMRGEAVPLAELARVIAPAFIQQNGRRTDAVVLACTHYPLLGAEMEAVAPWPVSFIDPAAAIARQLVRVVAPAGKISHNGSADNRTRLAVFTRPLDHAATIRRYLFSLGIDDIEIMKKPVS